MSVYISLPDRSVTIGARADVEIDWGKEKKKEAKKRERRVTQRLRSHMRATPSACLGREGKPAEMNRKRDVYQPTTTKKKRECVDGSRQRRKKKYQG